MAQEPVLFPDAAALVVAYLRDELVNRGDAASVGTMVPDPSGRFVLVRRLGGPRQTLVSDAPEIGIECWDALAEDAHDLAQVCRALLFALRGTTQGDVAVYRVSELAGPAELPDPLSDQPRYVFTHQLHLRGAPLPAASS